MKPFAQAILLAFVTISVASCGAEESTSGPNSQNTPNPVVRNVILATTTSTYDTGLLDVLIPKFQEKTGYIIKPIAVGTGKAMAMAERGEPDVLLVHAPSAEKALMEKGIVINRQLVMHNYFAIVSPPDDPAGIRGGKDAALALARILNTNSLFISRGDDSGTHKMEKALWAAVGVEPTGGWYQQTGQGMGATLRIASEKQGYTLTDRGSYLALKKALDLDVLVEGDPALLNIYSVMQVNPSKFPKVNKGGAEAFVNFMVSSEAQSIIKEFGVDKFGEQLFIPDAGKLEEDIMDIGG